MCCWLAVKLNWLVERRHKSDLVDSLLSNNIDRVFLFLQLKSLPWAESAQNWLTLALFADTGEAIFKLFFQVSLSLVSILICDFTSHNNLTRENSLAARPTLNHKQTPTCTKHNSLIVQFWCWGWECGMCARNDNRSCTRCSDCEHWRARNDMQLISNTSVKDSRH